APSSAPSRRASGYAQGSHPRPRLPVLHQISWRYPKALPLTAVPAKAGTHFSEARAAEGWVPAFAGTAKRNSCGFRLLAAPQDLRHLAEDRDRDFGRRHRTDRQADRPVDPREIGLGEAHLFEPAAARGMGTLRAEGADVEAFR